ncbi:hypothetical protein CUMW_121500, partial [Citrus unshiu]
MSLFPLSRGFSFGFGLGGIDRVCSSVSAFLLLVTGFPLLPYNFVWVGPLESRDIILSLSLVGSTFPLLATIIQGPNFGLSGLTAIVETSDFAL